MAGPCGATMELRRFGRLCLRGRGDGTIASEDRSTRAQPRKRQHIRTASIFSAAVDQSSGCCGVQRERSALSGNSRQPPTRSPKMYNGPVCSGEDRWVSELPSS